MAKMMTNIRKINEDRDANADSELEVMFRPTVAVHGYLAELAELGIFGGPTADDVAQELVNAGVRALIRQGWFDQEAEVE